VEGDDLGNRAELLQLVVFHAKLLCAPALHPSKRQHTRERSLCVLTFAQRHEVPDAGQLRPRRSRVAASCRPPKYFSSARKKISSVATSANKVRQERNFMSSGLPKMACADFPS